MNYRFFGQFLLEKGVISAEELAHALKVQEENHQYFGQYALRLGYITLEQLNELLLRQKRTSARLGELAIELGMLTHAQVKEILGRQKADHLYLGEVLVRLGYLDREELYLLLEAYHKSLPVVDTLDWEDFPYPALYQQLVVIGNTYLQRLLKEPVRLHSPHFSQQLQYAEGVSGVRFFHRDTPFRFFLYLPTEVGKVLTQRYMEIEEEPEARLIRSAQEEIVNIISGNFLAYAQHLGKEWTLEPPITLDGERQLLPLYGSHLYGIPASTPHFQWEYILDIGEKGGKDS